MALITSDENSTDSGSTYINDFSRSRFLTYFLTYGLAFGITFFLAFLLLRLVQFDPGQLPTLLAFKWPFRQNFASWVGFVFLLCLLLLLAPLVLALLWGIEVYINLNHLFGQTIFFLAITLILVYVGFNHFRFNAWRLLPFAKLSFFLCLVQLYAWLFWVDFLHSPFDYRSISAVFLSLNSLLLILLVFITVRAQCKKICDYVGLDLSEFTLTPQISTQFTWRSILNDLSNPSLGNKHSKLIIYLLSFCVLLVYALTVLKTTDKASFNRVGFITLGVCVVADFCLALCVYAGRIRSPVEACVYLILTRLILTVSGNEFWFVGHCFIYILLSLFFVTAIVDHLIPPRDTRSALASELSKIIEGSKLPNSVTSFHNSLMPSVHKAEGTQLLQSGFVKMGRYSKTRIGKFVFLHSDSIAFIVLTMAFLIDLIISAKKSTTKIVLQHDHAQWLVGIFALFLSFGYFSFGMMFRVYGNSGYQLNFRIVLAAAVLYGLCVGCGVFLYTQTKSAIIISCSIYLPLVAYLITWAAIRWVRNDFRIRPVKQVSDSSASIQREHRLLIEGFVNEYGIITAVLTAVVLIVGLGVTVSIHSEPSYIGYCITAVILILFSTITVEVEWFNTFELSKTMITQLLFTFACFISFLLLLWRHGLHGEKTNRASALLFVLFVYPILVVLSFALYKWRDDKWKMNTFVKHSLAVCCVLVGCHYPT